MRMKKSLTKKEILRKREEIRGILQADNRIDIKGSRLLFKKNNLDYNRLLVTVPRKFGNAVTRNKAKRYGKEIFRHIKHDIVKGYDFCIVLFPGIYKYGERNEQITSLMRKANLFQ